MRNTVFLFFLCIILLCGCYKPWGGFNAYVPPPVPDYSHEDAWAGLPWRHDAPDTVPPGAGLTDNQANARADVFYIYPTLDFRTDEWNADIHNKNLDNIIDRTAMRCQATVFNGSCRVFAPRYRQAILYSFMDKGSDGKKALDLAYGDVRNAFIYYMLHYNNGRPVIIAGHSQGALMAYRLIKEFFDTTAFRHQLVAAYLVGYHINRDSLKNLRPCDSASQTGCYVSWNTVAWGGLNKAFGNYFQGVCINPLNWTEDTAFVGADYNMGSVNFKFSHIDKHEVGAKCKDGSLWISLPKSLGYVPLAGSYHVFDYNLFYMNIRANVDERVNAFLQQSKK